MSRCDFRTLRECNCAPGHCQQATPVIDITRKDQSALIPMPSWLDGLAFGLVLSGVFAIGLVLLEQDLKRQALASQESQIVRRDTP